MPPVIVQESDEIIRLHNRRVNLKRPQSASSHDMSLYSILRAWVVDNPNIAILAAASSSLLNKNSQSTPNDSLNQDHEGVLAESQDCDLVIEHLVRSLHDRPPLPPLDALAHLNSTNYLFYLFIYMITAITLLNRSY